MSDASSPDKLPLKRLEFENEVAQLLAALGADRIIVEPAVAGQHFDLLIHQTGPDGGPIRTVVECKAFTLKVGRGTVNSFATLVEHLKRDGHVEKGIMVALSGFTALARRDAKRRGITVYTLDQLRVLVEYQRAKAKLAEVLRAKQPRAKSKHVFVLMPFDAKFDDVYYFGIRGAVQEVGFTCDRADDIHFVGDVIEKVVDQIRRAEIIVAEMTDQNPNVFYEVGIAHALGKKVALVVREAEEIPFDLRKQNHIVYGGSIKRLRERLASLLRVLGDAG